MGVLNASHPFEHFFEEISAIPRGSGNEQGMVDYLIAFASTHGLRYYTDEAKNVVIYKDATPGYEAAPTVILQAHTDMVCAKKPGVAHDFLRDGIELVRDGNIVHANGTTLGADDGTGVATILGLLDDESLAHPTLEALFTASEESGMQGAAQLDYSVLKGRRLISMDSGGENETSVNSAGFAAINMRFTGETVPVHAEICRLRIDGLRGGHSGAQIDEERVNAIKVAAALLSRCCERGIKLRIASFRSGIASNVIPYAAEVIFACNHCEAVERLTQEYVNELRSEIGDFEPKLNVVLETTCKNVNALSAADSQKLIQLLTLLPHGRRHRSMRIDGFVTASSNLATVELNGGNCSIEISVRAETKRLLEELVAEIRTLGKVFKISTEIASQTPCWVYNGESKLRAIAAELMPRVLGKELVLSYEHGGMETGYFASNLPGVDIYVIGPIGREIHTPNEWMDLDSCHRVFEFMRQYLPLLH